MDPENINYLESGDISSDGRLNISSGGKPVVIMISAKFCEYSSRFLPEFQKAAAGLRGKAVMAIIVIDQQKKLGEVLHNYIPDFKGVPMVVLFENGVYSKTYDVHGPRTSAGLIEFVNKNL